MSRRLDRRIEIWERLSEAQVACYQCLEVIAPGKFCVQSRDFFTQPLEQAAHLSFLDQFVTLLSEESPEIRTPLCDSLEAAIQAHNSYFV
jgi:hypothetical protein